MCEFQIYSCFDKAAPIAVYTCISNSHMELLVA